MNSNNKTFRQNKINKALKATLPFFVMLGSGAVASTRNFSASSANRRIAASAVVHVDSTLNSDKIDPDARNVVAKKRSAFGAFTKGRSKAVKPLEIKVDNAALDFLKGNKLLSARSTTKASLSGNTLSSNILGRKVFAAALPFTNTSITAVKSCPHPNYDVFSYFSNTANTIVCALFTGTTVPFNGVQYNTFTGPTRFAQCQAVYDLCLSAGNAAPEFDDADDTIALTLNEDAGATTITDGGSGIGVTDTDAGDTLTWSQGSTAPTKGATSISGTKVATGGAGDLPTTYTYTPTSNLNGADAFTIDVSDGNGGTDTITVNVTINDIADITADSVPANSTYAAASNLDFTLTFDESVTVTGSPRIALDIGGTSKFATFSTGNATATTGTILTFRYTVEAGLTDLNGIGVTSAVDLNGGTIIDTDGHGSGADLSNISFAATTSVLVDSIVPMVSSVSVPANATYVAGQNLDFTVNTDENVTVNTTGGTPSLALTIGATGKTASYLSGSGTSSLVFRYTVESGLLDTDGIAVGGAISLNSGTVQDAVGNNLTTTLNAVGSTVSVLVDSVVPMVSSVSVPANATYVAGQNLDFIVNTDENVTVNTMGGTPSLALTIGATGKTASYLSGSGTSSLVFRYTVESGLLDTDGIAVGGAISLNSGTMQDTVGNNLTTTLNAVGSTVSILVDSVVPTISSVSIPNSAHKVGDVVTATITVASDTDDYTVGSGNISGTINGYTLGSFSKTNNTTYTATFTVADMTTDVPAASNVAVNFTINDSSGNTSSAFTTAIIQGSDAIYANLPDVDLTASTNTLAEDGGASTLTGTLSGSLNNQWPVDVTVNLAYTGTGTITTDYTGASLITISSGGSTGTTVVTSLADTLYDATIAETIIVDINSLSVGNEGTINQQTLSITDAESAPVATLSVGNATVAENGGTSTITASLDNATYADVTVNLAYTGTATSAGIDYNTPSGSITILAGNTTGNAVTGVTSINDGLVEGNETIIMDITSMSGGSATESGTQQQTVTITDDDVPNVSLSVSASPIAEASGTSTITAILDQVTFADVTVTLGYTGTATDVSDYTKTNTVTILTGNLTGSTTLTAVQDTVPEPGETVIIDVTDVNGGLAVENGVQQQTVTITDDEVVNVSLSASPTTFNEVGGTSSVTATLDQATYADVTVNLGYSGTATTVTDYTTAGDITITAGQTSGSTLLTAVGDASVEGSETVIVDITGVTGGSAAENGVQQQTLTLTDTNSPPTDIVLTSTSINQSATGAAVNVGNLSSTDVDGGSFTYALVASGASGNGLCGVGNDANNASFQVTGASFETANGLMAGSYQVCIQTNDGEATFQKNFTITVADNVGPIIGSVSIPNSAHKVSDTVPVTITVISDTDDYTTGVGGISGNINGYVLSSLSKTNNTTYTATFTITDGGTDAAAASNITNSFTLTDSAGNTSSAFSTAISQPNDAIYANLPTVNLTASSNTLAEDGGASTLTGTLSGSLNNQWPVNVTVNLAYTGTGTITTDYTGASAITIASGGSTGTTVVTSLADTLFDAAIAETIIVDINSLSVGTEGITNQQTLSITDAESAPVTSLSVGSAAVAESGGTSTIIASLDNATYADVTVNLAYSGTATSAGTDYNTPSASITIPAGSTTANAATDITSVDDALLEGIETVVIDISSVTGGSATENVIQQQTVTITDDEAALVSLSVSSASILEAAGTSTITATLNQPTFEDVVVTLAYSGSATNVADYTGSNNITVLSGNITGSTLVTAVQDTSAEASETVVIDVASVAGGAAIENGVQQQTVTITDDEVVNVTLSASPTSFDEGAGTSTLTATLDKLTFEDVTVSLSYSGTATNVTDYTTAGDITVTAGQTTGTSLLTGVGDALVEGDETIIVDINNVTGGSAVENGVQQQTLTLNDTNSAPTADAQAVDVVENVATNIVLTATDVDTDPLTYSVITDPTNGVLSGTVPNLTYTPNTDFVGSDSFTFKANDGTEDSTDATISISVLGDLDGDGDPDVTDPDDDGDGIPDTTEGTGDADGDGIPNDRDTDSDGDGILDSDEGEVDSDGDGTADYLDSSLDEDNDGIPDIVETTVDTDNDGTADFLDPDSDNDGLTDSTESEVVGVDTDSDSIDDAFDVDVTGGVDANGDGIDDDVATQDTDADGIADRHDLDSDDDGIPDVIEAFLRVADADSDGINNSIDVDQTAGVDSDGDGIDDAFDIDFTNGRDADLDGIDDKLLPQSDRDSDGTVDYFDLDSDNDGMSDSAEAGLVGIDTDGDGIEDRFDVDITLGNDLNLDGIDDDVSVSDTDSDGIPDLHDLDSDNDSLYDVTEAGVLDADANALADPGTLLVDIPIDSDSDGTADFRDLDSDDDGVDDIDGTALSPLDSDDDGRVEITADTDGDGIDDSYDTLPNEHGVEAIDLDQDKDGIADVTEGNGDTDGDGVADYLDRDSDNDGLSDAFETDRPTPSGNDFDNDGIDDTYDVDMTGGLDDNQDGVDDQFIEVDTDLDGVADYKDTDSDDDGLSDTLEQLLTSLTGVDSDADGIDDSVDVDFTGGSDTNFDGIDDSLISLSDFDSDGILNFRDTDSDDDTVPDSEEGNTDSDDDGMPDYLDEDSDNDGISDEDENGDFNNDGINDRIQQERQVISLGGSGSNSMLAIMLLAGLVLLRRRKSAPVAAIAAASLLSLSAQAENSCELGEALNQGDCWYLGAGLGYAKLEPDLNNTSWAFSDDKDTTSKIMTGVRFAPHFSAELSYEDFGTAKLYNLNPSITETVAIDYSAYSLNLKYWLRKPGSEWNYFSQLGVAHFKTETSTQVLQDSNNQLTLGMGIQWHFQKNWFARMEVTAYGEDVTMLGFTFARHFGSD